MKIINQKILIFLTLFLLFFSLLIYPSPQTEEYSLKALYIKKFNNYINWPEWKLKDSSNVFFKIGVIGKSPIYKTLKQAYKGHKIFNKKVEVLKVNNFINLPKLNILFVSIKNKKKINKIVQFSKRKGILLIGDTPGLALSGIHINFYIKNGRLRFKINRKALLRSGFTASSFLLSLAEIVGEEGDSQ